MLRVTCHTSDSTTYFPGLYSTIATLAVNQDVKDGVRTPLARIAARGTPSASSAAQHCQLPTGMVTAGVLVMG